MPLWLKDKWFRLCGRDVLDRRRPNRASYWIDKPMPTDVRAYFRQY